mmetsp:Transcript_21630/g.29785  ORF Transcript_21630/g.29785 Transcript_21630/m.29785 type:complete len:389 (+) Transcript_21630:572-1738(+)
MYLLCGNQLDHIIQEQIAKLGAYPSLVVIDSIQTMQLEECTNAVGTVTQIRECTSRLVQYAKSTGTVVLLVGHVTKSGDVAGPRVLEHMVDTVLYVEGIERADFRLVRSMKNRFGSVSEVGVFTMTAQGLLDVSNPSELFMSSQVLSDGLEGSAVTIIMEGTRPILAEIQCLVSSKKQYGDGITSAPRRTADGFPFQRLLVICAVIEKRLRLPLWNRDIFLNVVGGLKVFEPLSDLAVAITLISSLTNIPVKASTAFIGELGLGGEIRGGRNTEARIAEAAKQGFTRIVLAKSSTQSHSNRESTERRYGTVTIQQFPCSTLREALSEGLETGGRGIDSVIASLNQPRRKRKSANDGNESEDVSYSNGDNLFDHPIVEGDFDDNDRSEY